jgi:type IV fimbrial biogenesis protein FimT
MTRKRETLPRHAGGYTLVELMTTLCIAGIVASVAVPSLTALAQNERRSAMTSRLLATLRVARSETLKRGGRPLVICGADDADGNGNLDAPELRCAGYDWTDGWMIGTSDDTNADSAVDPSEFTPLRVFPAGGAGQLTVTAGNFTASPPVAPAGTLLFRAFGKRTSNGTITICDARGPDQARAVIVSSVGRARVSPRRSDGSALRCP